MKKSILRHINKGRVSFYITLSSLLFTLTTLGSCQDMLDTENSRQLFEPSLSEKTDSVFYAYGILQAMQQLADQYYYQNEMRGDLVQPTTKADAHLKKLADFSADVTNRYDSVYLYYKVINNCNYYLKNRRQDLITGDKYVVINEYIAVASIRAWAFMQLVRNYGDVPYFTEPITSISEINSKSNTTPAKTILSAQAHYLDSLKHQWGYEYHEVPTYGKVSVNVGTTGWATTKYIQPAKCFIPLNVILGDLYLENGEYQNAAKAYYDYLYYNAIKSIDNIDINYSQQISSDDDMFYSYPSDYDVQQNQSVVKGSRNWMSIFTTDYAPGDVITYIPMAVSRMSGQTTSIPEAYGYMYYGSAGDFIANWRINNRLPETKDVMIVPSYGFRQIYGTAPYYYYKEKLNNSQRFWEYGKRNLGDSRFNHVCRGQGDTSLVYVQKPSNANIYLYRTTTVFLHLAEAMNRMGYPDAAFAVLKDGLNPQLLNYIDTLAAKQTSSAGSQTYPAENFYIKSRTAEMLSSTLPFLTNSTVFPIGTHSVGVHFHGAGAVSGLASPYQYSTVLGEKLASLNKQFELGLSSYSQQDSINAMEDILCDEYALEFAFEGTRFSDLQRIARHFNEAGNWGTDFGSRWFAKKLEGNRPLKDLRDPRNWYLPFK